MTKVFGYWTLADRAATVQVFVACGFDHGTHTRRYLFYIANLRDAVVANMFSLPLGIMLHADVRA